MLFARMTFVRDLSPTYSRDDIARIKSLFEKHSEDTRELYDEILHIYSSALARKFEGRESDGLKSVLILESRYSVRADAAAVYVPVSIIKSPLTYGIAAHETFHRYDPTLGLSDFEQRPIKAKQVLKILRMLYDPLYLVRAEGKAMHAEWEFMNQVPKDRRLQWLSAVESLDISAKEKSAFQMILTDTDLDFMQYLKNNYQIKRYSLTDTSKISLTRAAPLVYYVLFAAFIYQVGKTVAGEMLCPSQPDEMNADAPQFLWDFCFGPNAYKAAHSPNGETTKGATLSDRPPS